MSKLPLKHCCPAVTAQLFNLFCKSSRSLNSRSTSLHRSLGPATIDDHCSDEAVDAQHTRHDHGNDGLPATVGP